MHVGIWGPGELRHTPRILRAARWVKNMPPTVTELQGGQNGCNNCRAARWVWVKRMQQSQGCRQCSGGKFQPFRTMHYFACHLARSRAILSLCYPLVHPQNLSCGCSYTLQWPIYSYVCHAAQAWIATLHIWGWKCSIRLVGHLWTANCHAAGS